MASAIYTQAAMVSYWESGPNEVLYLNYLGQTSKFNIPPLKERYEVKRINGITDHYIYLKRVKIFRSGTGMRLFL
jgi:hypothetical protein